MMQRRVYFPFSAIVGMDKAKLALLAVAVDPTIGGVLLSGDKGTGKSTLVRALANVLPEIPVVRGCPFNCNPFNPLEMCDYHYEAWCRGDKLEVEYRKMRVVDLPLNITPDRLVGSIDVERTLREGRVVFKPGLLAEANRNILYIDEVNLLEDYIADLLLDAAASGWNIVEREGISFRHPSRFILVGSMNPEEGELRPQLLDRFGLYVDVSAMMSVDDRVEIVRRVEEFHRDPISFMRKYEAQEKEICEKVKRAREILPDIVLEEDLLRLIVDTVIKLGIRTHRAEIVIAKTAKAIAALEGRRKVTLEDVKRAMELALPHRVKLNPFETPPKKLSETLKQIFGEGVESTSHDAKREKFRNVAQREQLTSSTLGTREELDEAKEETSTGSSRGSNSIVDRALPEPPRRVSVSGLRPKQDTSENKIGPMSRTSRVRGKTAIAAQRGAIVDAITPVKREELSDVDLYATVRCAAARKPSLPLCVSSEDVKVRVRRPPRPHLHIIVLDTSGSMYARTKLEVASDLVNSIIRRSYVEKTLLSLIVTRGLESKIAVEPTRSHLRLLETLREVEIGGSTPLSDGLYKAYLLARRFLRKHRNGAVIVHVVTDGKANVFLGDSIDSDLKLLYDLYVKTNIKVKLYLVHPRYSLDITSVRDKLCSWVEHLGGEIYRYYIS